MMFHSTSHVHLSHKAAPDTQKAIHFIIGLVEYPQNEISSVAYCNVKYIPMNRSLDNTRHTFTF